MEAPLILTNVPSSVQQLYQTLTSFLTEQCGLSIRYISWETLKGTSRTSRPLLVSKIRDAILNNNSLRMRPANWKLDKDGFVVARSSFFEDYPAIRGGSGTSRIRFQNKRVPLEAAVAEVEQLVQDTLNDRSSIVKLVSLDVSGGKEGQKVMIPLWGWGLSAAESVAQCNDREIKFVFVDERIDSAQLQVACLLHALIEASWWYPNGTPAAASSPQSVLPLTATDDNKKLVSCIVDESLCYWNMSVVVLLERLQLFDQHFEEKGRSHTATQCSCQKLKHYNTSFLMKKVASIRSFLQQQNLDAEDFHTWFHTHLASAQGPDPALKLYLDLLQQEQAQLLR